MVMLTLTAYKSFLGRDNTLMKNENTTPTPSRHRWVVVSLVAVMAAAFFITPAYATPPVPKALHGFIFGGYTLLSASGVLESINKLTEIFYAIVKAAGGIMVVLGLIQFGMSFKSHDPSQRAQSLLQLAGGLIVFFAPELLKAIT